MFEKGVGISEPLFFIGVVENNDDPQLDGRVQVRAFSIHGNNKQIPTPELPWAICASGHYDPNSPIPPLNAFVYGMFLDGRDAQTPLILGLIPGQYLEIIDPEKNGWGVVPHRDGEELAMGTSPRDIGNPIRSRLARGESIEETYVLGQEMNRKEGNKIAGTQDPDDNEKYDTWSEPSSAYNPEYPHNRVIETRHHSIELDDTPKAERIMIRHKTGGFIQIDSSGAVTEKSVGDRYEVTDGSYHQSVGGHGQGQSHFVTIYGNSHVHVEGNKTEEITGNYELIVRGNAVLGAGGAMYLNAEMLQARGGDVKIEAKSTASVKAVKELLLGASGYIPGVPQLGLPGTHAGDVKIIANKVLTTGYYAVESFSGLFTKITSIVDTHITGSNLFIGMTGLLPPITPIFGAPLFTPTAPIVTPTPQNLPVITQGINILSGWDTNVSTVKQSNIQTGGITAINSGAAISINTGAALGINTTGAINMLGSSIGLGAGAKIDIIAPTVAIDTIVNLGSGVAVPPVPVITVPTVPGIAVPGLPAILPVPGTEIPEPPGKATSLAPATVSKSVSSPGFTGSEVD